MKGCLPAVGIFFVGVLELGSLFRATQGSIPDSLLFLLITLCLIFFNKKFEPKIKNIGYGAAASVFLVLVIYALTPMGRATHAAMLRQDTQDAAQKAQEEAQSEQQEASRRATEPSLSSSDSHSSENSPSDDKSSGQSDSANTSSEVDGVQYQVASVSRMKSIGDTQADGVFVIVKLSATNTTKETHPITLPLITLHDSENRTYQTSTNGTGAASLAGMKGFDVGNFELQPDITKTIGLVYEVPANAHGLTLKILPGMFSTSGSATLTVD